VETLELREEVRRARAATVMALVTWAAVVYATPWERAMASSKEAEDQAAQAKRAGHREADEVVCEVTLLKDQLVNVCLA
jgi:hypothetical protein